MNKIKQHFIGLIENIKCVFLKFPITVSIIYVYTLLLTFGNEVVSDKLFNQISTILNLSVFSTWLVEIIFSKKEFKNIKKNAFIILGILIASILNFVSNQELISESLSYRFIVAYCIINFFSAIYLLSKRKEKIEKYVLDVYINIKKTFILFMIVSVGIFALYEIFYVLIAKIEFDILVKILSLFCGFIIVPICLDDFTEKNAEDTKFNRFVFSKVLLTLLTLSFGIIYVYLFKMITNLEIPKNEVFMIVSFVFVSLIPICIFNKNYSESNKVLSKIIRILPILFIPLLILQAYAMIVRINQYGVTEERYAGIVFILFEIITIFLINYKNGEKTNLLFIVVSILTFFGVLSPFNYERISINSQEKIINMFVFSGVPSSELSDTDKKKVLGSYDYLNSKDGYIFDNEMIVKEYVSNISLKDIYNYNFYNREYKCFENTFNNVDIDLYKRMYRINFLSKYDEKINYSDNDFIYEIESQNGMIKTKINLKRLINEIVEENISESNNDFDNYSIIKIDEEYDFLIENFCIEYTKDGNKVEILEVNLAGFIMEK